MYYFLILLATLCIGIQFSLTKVFQKNVKQCLAVSVLFSIIMAFTATLYFLVICNFKIQITTFSLIMAGLFAVITILNNVLCIKILSIGRISVFTVFMMLGGMFLPFLYGLIFLDEIITIGKIFGIILMITALIMPMTEKSNEYITNKRLFYVLCFMIFFINGADGIVLKAHQINSLAVNTYEFSTLTYLINFVLSIIILSVIVLKAKNKTEIKNTLKGVIKYKNILIIIIFAIVYGTGGILILNSAIHLPASVLYPIVTGGTVIITSIFGWIFFKEKLSRPVIIGLILSFAATVCFMF